MLNRFGITEAGDAGLDLSWVDKLYPTLNVVISKHLTTKNEKLLDALVNNKDKVIFHCTCTGYGGTVIEPNVPSPCEVRDGVIELVRRGFPAEQIVLRTDPIIPTEKGIALVGNVWNLFAATGIKRCRVSVIDIYPHVRERMLSAVGCVPFDGFKAPKEMFDNLNIEMMLHKNQYCFESCAETDLPVAEGIGCISKKDFEVLHIPFVVDTVGGFQRKGCKCLAGKTELLKSKKQCPSGCIYCYWK